MGKAVLPFHLPSCLYLSVSVCFLIKEVTSHNYFNLHKLKTQGQLCGGVVYPLQHQQDIFSWGVILWWLSRGSSIHLQDTLC